MTPKAGLRTRLCTPAARLRAALLALGVAACASLPAANAMASTSVPRYPSFGHAVIASRDGAPRLLVDGRPFFFWGGAFFYDRIPPDRWRASMLAMRELGANTLDLYVPWNWHEVADGTFDFDGHTDPRRNLRDVLRLGKELGFFFIVRPGPVIRNEWRNGGYPAWLLTRPEYRMPLQDVLEGRYPATATLQNAHSDDAAAEWLRNGTHLRYASRWLHRELQEFRPVADRVLAVQLDDDQGAYIDNQTYPAPHLHAYLRWLERQVRDVVGPRTPVFINTYQMRAPWSSPVWTMGNWYQSDAYTVGMHDRVDLDFSTLLLRTNPRGPLAQSEFQAGWLAGPEDPAPRPADPRNTTVALDELLALGTQGIVDFPMQDTLAEPGWEAPFSNAFYGWDAALSMDEIAARLPQRWYGPGTPERSARYWPTREFGSLVHGLGPVLATARRIVDVAIAYGVPESRPDSRPPDGSAAIVARVREQLRRCAERGLTCALFDLRHPLHPAPYRDVVVGPELARAAPGALRALRAALRGTRTPLVASVPLRHGTGVTRLVSPDGEISIATNWSGRPVRVRFGTRAATLQPHSASIRAIHLALAALGAGTDPRRISSDDCDLVGIEPTIYGFAHLTLIPPVAARITPSSTAARICTATIEGDPHRRTVVLRGLQYMLLPSLQVTQTWFGDEVIGAPVGDVVLLARGVDVPVDAGGDAPADGAVVRMREAIPALGAQTVVLLNDRVRVIIDPAAGARAFSLQAYHSGGPSPSPYAVMRLGLGWSPNAFDATGAWRDDVDPPLPPSPRDYIARYTHTYPAGTFNRTYRVTVLASGARAVVRFTYAMPDAEPAGTTFERIVTLEPHASRLVVDERLVVPGARASVRAVVRSSLRSFVSGFGGDGVPALDPFPRGRARIVSPAQTALGSFGYGCAFVVAWAPGAVERASWTPYRSTGTLALRLAPGWRRTVYSYAWVGTPEAARSFFEAERAWAAANPAPSDG
jgi:hypothetical protein